MSIDIYKQDWSAKDDTPPQQPDIDEILDMINSGGEDFLTWTDNRRKVKQALYSRLAAKAVIFTEHIKSADEYIDTKAVPLSVIKELFNIKEKE